MVSFNKYLQTNYVAGQCKGESLFLHLSITRYPFWSLNVCGLQTELCFCRSTAPKLYDEASAVSFVSAFGLSIESIVGLQSSSFTCKFFLLCSHIQTLSFSSKYLNGCDNCANLLENFPIWFTIPRNRLNIPFWPRV